MEFVNWLIAHGKDLAVVVTSVIGTASLIVKLTPTQKDDNFLAKVVAFISRFIALNDSKHEK